MDEEVLVYDGLQSCPYLPGRVARMPLYRQSRRLTPAETDVRLARAERRVGIALYRTRCPTCSACKGLRILTEAFRPSRSQRRVRNRWRRLGDRLRIDVGLPQLDGERLDLYNRHKSERGLDNHDDEPLDERGYAAWLLHSCMTTVEVAYRIDGRLIGVGILDLGHTSQSSVYFYFDPSPEVSRLSPGVFSVLHEVALAREHGRAYHYLGLWVRDCPALAYKADYYPHERLEDGAWRRRDKATDPARE